MTKSDIGIVEKLLRIPKGGNYPLAIRPNLPANPDGPEAAAIITEMVEALEEIRREYRQYGAAAIDVMFTIADDTLAKVRSPRGMKED